MQRLVARVVALMLADDDGRMTAAEIGAALHVSPGAVSGAMSFLREYGFVTTERERGSRHDVTLARAAMLGYLVDQLQRGVDAVGGVQTRAGRRLAYSVEFYRFIAVEMDRLIASWESRREQLRAQFPND
jgi:DNA-binding transcriptional ArsR family regulator